MLHFLLKCLLLFYLKMHVACFVKILIVIFYKELIRTNKLLSLSRKMFLFKMLGFKYLDINV